MLERTLFLQEAVDTEVALIASKSLDWIFELPMHSQYKFEYAGEKFNGIIQFLPKDHGRKNNSFMLAISRTLSPGVYRDYTSGFLFEKGKVLLVTTDAIKLSE
ncbi:hypothetical protein NBRC116583_39260 [Arenicella sp. 4NH20-0111]|uniref:hypothetical protein n=1 Tax=Arenicella sp. 4NH20-0111 TaxID=3127648 RepID=UPI003104A0F9